MLGGGQRYQASYEAAKRAFAVAQADHQQREAARRRGSRRLARTWDKTAAEAKRKAEAHNAHVAEMAGGFREHDRFAVSEYVQLVLDRSPYPEGFPAERHAGYVPESSLLAVEWFLPTFDIIPEHKAFRHVKTRKARRARRQASGGGAAALQRRDRPGRGAHSPRGVHGHPAETWSAQSSSTGTSTPSIRLPGRRSGRRSSRCAPRREKFDELVLTEPRFDPVASIKRHFFAAISPHPEELKPVEPVMPFSRADPRVVEAIDVISTLDQRPNLLDLKPEGVRVVRPEPVHQDGLRDGPVPGQW